MKSFHRGEPDEATEKALKEVVRKAKEDIEASEEALEEPSTEAREAAEGATEDLGGLSKVQEDVEVSRKALQDALSKARQHAEASKKTVGQPSGQANRDANVKRCAFQSYVGCPLSVVEEKNKTLEDTLARAREESRLAREEAEAARKALDEALSQAKKGSPLIREDADTTDLKEALGKAREEVHLAGKALAQAQKESKIARQEAAAARKALDEALTKACLTPPQYMLGILHKLRTPLHSVIGFSKLLLDGKVSEVATQKEFLTIINQQTEYLQRLVDELTEVSNIEPGPSDTLRDRPSQ